MTLLPDPELQRWNQIFAGDDFYYGLEPGPVARRAVRYHRHQSPATALDAGCGEGQDLLFLAQAGYEATGLDGTQTGADKARRLLQERGQNADVLHADLRAWHARQTYDLVLAVNALQFLGADAPACLDALMQAVSPRGVMGLSIFARENGQGVEGTIWTLSLEELLARFEGWQLYEAAKLWQWNAHGESQAFVTLIARKR